MTRTNVKSLVSKLSDTCRSAMEAAANTAHRRTHHDIEVEHVLVELMASPASDIATAFKAFHVDSNRLEQDLRANLDRLRTGSPRIPVLSRHIPRWLESAWLLASVDCAATTLRSGHLLAALVQDDDLRRAVGPVLDPLTRVPAEEFLAQMPVLMRHSNEVPSQDHAPAQASANATGTPSLDRYTTDLTALARAGRIDPVLGRETEIRQMVDILLRRRQNNPILTGEPGVGKTAVAEGLALRIARGEVPPPLRPASIRALDLGLLQAGASVKGEFESRLKGLMDEVKASPVPVILFIDEAHTMIGAGGQAGQNDAANLLKPALARGELRTIAATTWSEYKRYFEKDAALARRFQVVKVEEPDETAAIQMLRGVAAAMEAHHHVRILEEAVVESVRLTERYLSGRQLPDKAISALDTACARVALSQAATPPPLEDVLRRLGNLEREEAALRREGGDGNGRHEARLAEIARERIPLEAAQEDLSKATEVQRSLVGDIQDLRRRLQENPASPADRSDLEARLSSAQAQLRTLHRTQPLVYDCVDAATLAEVVSGWTGIPLGRMVTDELDTLREMEALLKRRVLGQDHALCAIARCLQASWAGLEDPAKPKGVFLLTGPSGVGKTETAHALADLLYGGERNLITINMSEYQEAHTVSGLKGSPPGYVGYGEGGVLTEAVRRRPHSVLLLDEVEKAHPDVLELFYQVFDRGRIEDAEGREIDFRHTIIILTSNVGAEHIHLAMEHGVTVEGVSRPPTPEDLTDLLRPTLLKAFKPAFLGRLTVVPYFPVGDEVLTGILRLRLERLAARVKQAHGTTLTWDPAVLELLLARCTEVESGARNADAVLSTHVTGRLSDLLLEAMATGRKPGKLALRVRKGHLHLAATATGGKS